MSSSSYTNSFNNLTKSPSLLGWMGRKPVPKTQNPSPSGQLITPRETSGTPGNHEPPASLSIVHLEWIDLQVLRKPSASSGLSYEILYGKWKQRITKQKDAQVGHLSPQQITCYGNALQPAGFSAQIFCRFFGGVWPWKFNCSAYVQSLRHKLLQGNQMYNQKPLQVSVILVCECEGQKTHWQTLEFIRCIRLAFASGASQVWVWRNQAANFLRKLIKSIKSQVNLLKVWATFRHPDVDA